MIFYHVTRMGNEESILREGLRPDRMSDRWQRPRRKKAVFLWGSLKSARIAERSEAFNGQLDGAIFRVRIPRSWVFPDETFVTDDPLNEGFDEPRDRFACFRRIPPERLEILRYGRWRRREDLKGHP